MSIVTSGVGNLASEWANGINYGLIVKTASDGELTNYAPSADTDVARGTALKTAVTSLSDNESLTIKGSLTYNIGDDDLKITGLSNVSIVGVGNPVIHGEPISNPEIVNIDKTSENVNVSGITVVSDVKNGTYAGSHKYCFVHNGSGLVDGCQFILATDVVTIQATYSFKTIVHLGNKGLTIRNCDILTLNSVTGMAEQVFIGAFHDLAENPGVNGSDYLAFIGCNFLSQNIATGRINTPPQAFLNCSSNIDGLGGLTYLNIQNAQSIIHPDYLSLIDDTLYSSTWTGVDKSTYRGSFQVLTGSTDEELFRIFKLDGTVISYEIKISDDSGCFWHGYVRAGVVDTLAGSLTDGFTKYAVDVTDADNHIYSVTKDGSTNKNSVTVYYLPTQQRNTNGSITNTSDIVFKDVEE